MKYPIILPLLQNEETKRNISAALQKAGLLDKDEDLKKLVENDVRIFKKLGINAKTISLTIQDLVTKLMELIVKFQHKSYHFVHNDLYIGINSTTNIPFRYTIKTPYLVSFCKNHHVSLKQDIYILNIQNGKRITTSWPSLRLAVDGFFGGQNPHRLEPEDIVTVLGKDVLTRKFKIRQFIRYSDLNYQQKLILRFAIEKFDQNSIKAKL